MFIKGFVLSVIFKDVESKPSLLSIKFNSDASHLSPLQIYPILHPIYEKKKTLLLLYNIIKNLRKNNMNKYENHTDRRIRELHERMRKLGRKKKVSINLF